MRKLRFWAKERKKKKKAVEVLRYRRNEPIFCFFRSLLQCREWGNERMRRRWRRQQWRRKSTLDTQEMVNLFRFGSPISVYFDVCLWISTSDRDVVTKKNKNNYFHCCWVLTTCTHMNVKPHLTVFVSFLIHKICNYISVPFGNHTDAYGLEIGLNVMFMFIDFNCFFLR